MVGLGSEGEWCIVNVHAEEVEMNADVKRTGSFLSRPRRARVRVSRIASRGVRPVRVLG